MWGWVIFFAVISATIGTLIGEKRNAKSAGFWLGLLLGPIGILILVLTTPADGRPREPQPAFKSAADLRAMRRGEQGDSPATPPGRSPEDRRTL